MLLSQNSEVILETSRLLLEPINEHHAEHLFRVLADPAIYTFIPQESPELEDLRERYRRLRTRRSPDGTELWLNWAVRIKNSAPYLGYVQATLGHEQKGDFAYVLGSAFWKQGYATEACQRVLEFLFETYPITEISANVDTRNQASYQLLERLGFTLDKTHLNADYFKGHSSDEYEYHLRKEDFVFS
jgi:[ribosomal protein S5]-alanine N-acetyltransferase